MANFESQPVDAKLEVIEQRMQDYYLNLADTILVRLNMQYLAGASIGSMKNDTVIAWFNNQPFHTAPLAVNLAHNAIVRAMLSDQHSIHLVNSPIPYTIDSRLLMLNVGNNIGFQLASNVGFAMAFVGAFYIMFYVKVSAGSELPFHSICFCYRIIFCHAGTRMQSKIITICKRRKCPYILDNFFYMGFYYIHHNINSASCYDRFIPRRRMVHF